MKHSILPALTMATLLLGCAHGSKNQRANNEANAAERAEARAERDQRRAENESQPIHEQERVDVPRRRSDGDRMASANGVVPEPRPATDGRSEDSNNLNAMDQGNGEIDLDMTQRIRKAVMADDSLSFSAKNATIISRDGRVTLRGKVKTAEEKATIYKCAVSAAGVGKVSNDLEVDHD